MQKISNYILPIWLALASSLSLLGQMPGLVLCFSSQGHVALESEHEMPDCSTSCSSVEQTDDVVATNSCTEHHTCFDIAICGADCKTSRSRSAMLSRGFVRSVAIELGSSILADVSSVEHSCASQIVGEPLLKVRRAELRALGTVVLLI